jgi:transposase-like protein
MAIVWPCPLTVDQYVAGGRDVAVPRPDCPDCGLALTFRSGYERFVRSGGLCHMLWLRRGQCRPCGQSHVLLPSFLVSGRLDAVTGIGAVIVAVLEGAAGVRPVAERAGVPHTTARDWVRRFGVRAGMLASGFAALAVALGDVVPLRLSLDPIQAALDALRRAWAAGMARTGVASVGLWAFASLVTGGGMIAATMNPLWIVIGSRRFMPPVP